MTGRKQCLPDRFGSKAEVLSSPACRLGGAKRYPSIAFCRDDGFRGAQPIRRTELSLLFEIRVPSLRGAKRRSNPCSLCGEMDCFASLAMTAQHLNCLCCLKLEYRHCEERSDEAIHLFYAA